MSHPELAIHLLSMVFWVFCLVAGLLLSVLSFLLSLMRGSFGQEEQAVTKAELMLAAKKKSQWLLIISSLNDILPEAPTKVESQDDKEEEKEEEERSRKKSLAVTSRKKSLVVSVERAEVERQGSLGAAGPGGAGRTPEQ